MLAPSVVTHALLLLWLALALSSPAPRVELYPVDLLPPTPTTPTAPAIAPEPPIHGPPLGTPPRGAPTAGAIPGVAGGRAGDGQLPAYVPPAARAGRVLTAPDSANAVDTPLDFSIVQGNAGRYAGGVTSSRGTSERAVLDSRARDEGVQGVVGGTGTGIGGPTRAPQRRAAVTPEVDRSRPALPVVSSWSCAFPPEADVAQVDFARARIVVTVAADGRAESAVVLSDPGNGFGDAARRCALAQRYTAARDRSGNPQMATTAPITVTFTR